MSTLGGKKYGLILPSKKANVAKKFTKPSVFGDSSSDEEDGRGHVNISLRLENEKKSKQTHETVAKALVEDPNVFEYDSLYDDMVAQKRKADPRLQKKDTKPKYIAALKKATERRKIEQDIIYERKVQLEMEREGKEYGDEEAFLTSAYHKKLEERKRMEEELREEAQREKANDITKQKDLSRFYQHLMNQQESTTAAEEKPKSSSVSKESRRRSGGSKGEEEATTVAHTSRQLDERTREHKEKELSPHESENSEAELIQPKDSGSQDNGDVKVYTDVPVDTAVEVDIEERRRIASAKRTDSQAFMSARERYMARKKAKLATTSSSSP